MITDPAFGGGAGRDGLPLDDGSDLDIDVEARKAERSHAVAAGVRRDLDWGLWRRGHLSG